MTHASPDTVGELTPAELISAMQLFDSMYRTDG